MRNEGGDDLKVTGETKFEGEVPFSERNQRLQAPIGILLGQSNVESSFVLNELLGDGGNDASGKRASFGELVDGELALEFNFTARLGSLVPGHGRTPGEVLSRSDTKGIRRRTPPSAIVVVEQISVTIFAETDFSDRTSVDKRIKTEDIRRLLTSVDGQDVEQKALGGVVEGHLDDWRVGDVQVFAGSKIVDSASSGESRFRALSIATALGGIAVLGVTITISSASRRSLGVEGEASLTESSLDFILETGAAHASRGIPVNTKAIGATSANLLETRRTVGNTIT